LRESPATTERRLLAIREAVKAYGQDLEKLEYQIRSGALPARKICGKVRVTIEALDQHYGR
jgi:hypothetical protein